MSVMTCALRHRRAKKNTVSMPLIKKHHQSQLPATPWEYTSPVTTRGVSAANVVATIEAPASHPGTCRPEMKYSLRLSPPRRVEAKTITADRTKYAPTIAQSIAVRFMDVRSAQEEVSESLSTSLRPPGQRERVRSCCWRVLGPRDC